MNLRIDICPEGCLVNALPPKHMKEFLPCKELTCLSVATLYTLLNSSGKLGSAPAASSAVVALENKCLQNIRVHLL